MFQILPKTMFRLCRSVYDLEYEILDLLKNYEYDEILTKILGCCNGGSVLLIW